MAPLIRRELQDAFAIRKEPRSCQAQSHAIASTATRSGIQIWGAQVTVWGDPNIVALTTLAAIYIVIICMFSVYVVMEFSRWKSRASFRRSLKKTLQLEGSDDEILETVEMISNRWSQSPAAVNFSLSSVLNDFVNDDSIRREAKRELIDRTKRVANKQQEKSLLGRLPPILEVSIRSFMGESIENKDRLTPLIIHFRDIEDKHQKELARQNRKNNISLLIGVIGAIGAIPFVGGIFGFL